MYSENDYVNTFIEIEIGKERISKLHFSKIYFYDEA